MADSSQNIPTWLQEYGQLGGATLVTAILTWFTTHRSKMAEAKTAEAAKSVEFEQAINDRTKTTIDGLLSQVQHLTTLVESQSEQLRKQSDQMSIQAQQMATQSTRMQELEAEIIDLRQTLDATNIELHRAKSLLPATMNTGIPGDDFS